MSDANGKRKRAEQLESVGGAGVGWRTLASSSCRQSAGKDSGMGDFGRYMAEKQRKLRSQFQSDSSNKLTSGMAATDVNAQLPDSFAYPDVTLNVINTRNSNNLFKGISIFVNGYTIPSHQELRSLMVKHGGRFENYFSKDYVTHIICSTLPDSKFKNPRLFSRGLPVVKPDWIVDSISTGKVLPLSSYYLEQLAFEHPNQSILSRFFGTKKDNELSGLLSGLDHSIFTENEQIMRQNSGNEFDTSVQLQLETGAICSKDGGALEERSLQDDLSMPACANDFTKQDSESSFLQCMKVVSNVQAEDQMIEHQGLWSDDMSLAISATVQKPEDIHSIQCGKTGSSAVHAHRLHTGHCTLGDTNFVQSFFKNSRLHFIGTWRNRYYSRFTSGERKSQEEGSMKFHTSLNEYGSCTSPIIMHIDMDCFFVSVVVRNHPLLSGKPVAVCHSDNALGTAEISSANYCARGYGVKSGMFVRDAKTKCPDLEIVPYDFEGYQQVADQFYDILHKHCSKVQAISCDEAYLDVTCVGDPIHLASTIRKDVFDVTKCTASVGIATNLLLARLATRKAKPDGLYHIEPEQVEEFIANISVEDLPGVGWALQEKLHKENIYNCRKLQTLSKETLQRDFGLKTGEMLWCYARGIDHREVQVIQERKSIGAEVNWGVRFNCIEDAHHFLTDLCKEVCMRLHNAATCGRTFTLKVKKRKEGAGDPVKFMGCGSCDNLSKSVTVASATDELDILIHICQRLFASFCLDVREIRGMGLQVTKLEQASNHEGHQEQKVLDFWLGTVLKHGSMLESSENQESPKKLNAREEIKLLINSTTVADTGNKEQKNLALSPASCQEVPVVEVVPNMNSKEGPECVEKIDEPLPWRLKSEDPKPKWKLGRVLKGPFSRGLQHKVGKGTGKQNSIAGQVLPPVSELDHSVLASLPSDILTEINEAYDGAIAKYISGGTDVLSNHDKSDENKFSNVGGSSHCDVATPVSNSTIKPCMVATCQEKSQWNPKNAAPIKTPLEEPRALVAKDCIHQKYIMEGGMHDAQSDQSIPAVVPFRFHLEAEGQSNQCSKSSAILSRKFRQRSSPVDASRIKEGNYLNCVNMTASQSEDCNPQVLTLKIEKTVQIEPMPVSMSQVDIATLKELPLELQQDILKSLPAHRPKEVKSERDKLVCANVPMENPPVFCEERDDQLCHKIATIDNNSDEGCETEPSSQFVDLWIGSPPRWINLIKKVQGVGSALLNLLSGRYLKCYPPLNLSSHLLEVFTFQPANYCSEFIVVDESIQCCLELIRQYIQLKVSSDIEEVFKVLRLLRRLTGKSSFWADVYELILPIAQVMIGDLYGGRLAL